MARLDLRDPGNLAVARALVDVSWPWPTDLIPNIRAVAARIASTARSNAARRRSTTRRGRAAAEGSEGMKFGLSYKRIKVHRSLVDASARVGGLERRRQDCQVSR